MSDTRLWGMAKQYLTLKRQRRALDDELKDLEQSIKELMNGDQERVVEGIRIKNTPYTTYRFDVKAFCADAPALYEKYLVESQHNRFTVT